jgi:hypothetical protein
MKTKRLIATITLVTILTLSFLSVFQVGMVLAIQDSPMPPPAPQMEEVLPIGVNTGSAFSVLSGVVEFVYDFHDEEGDIYDIDLMIYGPAPYHLKETCVDTEFQAIADPTADWNTTDWALATLLGVQSVTYSEAEEKWTITVNIDKTISADEATWDPWGRSEGDPVWVEGKYTFYFEVRDEVAWAAEEETHDPDNGTVIEHRWGYLNHPPEYATYTYYFHSIQTAIDSVSSGDTILVKSGVYNPFTVNVKDDLTIKGYGHVVINGSQQDVEVFYKDKADLVVFVNDSSNIVLEGLDIQGDDLGDGSGEKLVHGVLYQASTGTMKLCRVSPNTAGDDAQNTLAVAIISTSEEGDGVSDLLINECTIENYGRVGVYIRGNVTIALSEIVGQVYDDEGFVCYGVEVEQVLPVSPEEPTVGSYVYIYDTEIYNNDNTFLPSPTWTSDAIMINGWMLHYNQSDSTVIMENCDIHDNYNGIEVLNSSLSYAHNNNICNNRNYGVLSAPAYDNTTASFDATLNWWGTTEIDEITAMISGDVIFAPWLASEGGEPVEDSVTEGIDSGTGTVDAKDEADTEVDYNASGSTTVTVTDLTSIPEGTAPFKSVGKSVDVYVPDPTQLNSITIKVHYDEGELGGVVESTLRMYYWEDVSSTWQLCSYTGVNTVENYIWATLNSTSEPGLDYLLGGPFTPGVPEIILTPDEGFVTTITGGGFTPTTGMTIYWGATKIDTIPTSVTTDGVGEFTAIFAAITSAPGTYTISATDGISTAYATFTVPDMTGPVGPVGPKGEQGSVGPQGAQGVPGPQGEQGLVGPQGEQGIQGPQGETGEQGEKGDVGPQGEQGQQGIQGDKGEKGDVGPQGEQGPQGEPGEPAPVEYVWFAVIISIIAIVISLIAVVVKKQ